MAEDLAFRPLPLQRKLTSLERGIQETRPVRPKFLAFGSECSTVLAPIFEMCCLHSTAGMRSQSRLFLGGKPDLLVLKCPVVIVDSSQSGRTAGPVWTPIGLSEASPV